MSANGGGSRPGSGGPWVVLIAISAFFLVVVLVVGGAVALRVGPFARAPGTPVVSAAPGSQSTPTGELPTNSPGSDPTPTPTQPTGTPSAPAETGGPIESPTSPLAALLLHVPPALLESCEATEPEAPVLAGVTCTTDGGAISVRYHQYGSADSLYPDYDEVFRGAEIDAESGRCYEANGDTITATPNKWPAEHGYSVDGQPVGRYMCREVRDGFDVYWTDERFSIIGSAQTSIDNLDGLVRFWLTAAGPFP